MSGRLIALEKLPRVSPVDVRETWHHIFVKYGLKVMGYEATHRFRDDQMCARLKTGIYGVIHGVQSIWEVNLTEEN